MHSTESFELLVGFGLVPFESCETFDPRGKSRKQARPWLGLVFLYRGVLERSRGEGGANGGGEEEKETRAVDDEGEN